MSTPLGSSSNLIITLGVFLKLLGFFVVLFSYSEFVPNKVDQAEESLYQRFNVNLSLPEIKSGQQPKTLAIVQNVGRSFDAIDADLKTQIDLFSTEKSAHDNIFSLHLPAQQLLKLNGQRPKSADFDQLLFQTLQRNKPSGYIYRLKIIGSGNDAPTVMRALGEFAQKMVSDGYPERLVTIGFNDAAKDPSVQLLIEAVPQ